MIKIKDNYKVQEIDVKRFYLPCIIDVECPKCKEKYEYDQYVSYPEVNKDIKLDMYCYECEHEWEEKIKIVLGLEIIK